MWDNALGQVDPERIWDDELRDLFRQRIPYNLIDHSKAGPIDMEVYRYERDRNEKTW